MDKPKIIQRGSPEQVIRDNLVKYLRAREWFVVVTHGNMYQQGLPDLYATHSKFRHRWIEVKLPNMKGSKFTAAQLDVFPKMIANGSPVWILTAATEDEYNKLFQPCNFHYYLLTKL